MVILSILIILILGVLPALLQGSAYPVHKDFAFLARFKAPMIRIIFIAGNRILSFLPRLKFKEEGISVKDETLGNGVKGWMMKPKETWEHGRCILFIHGGGFVYKGAPYHYSYALKYAKSSGCDLFFVDYSMAYNTEYGTPLNDCISAYKELCTRYSKVSIVGDSAGGFLALKTALASERKPDRLCLIYPVVDCSMRTASMAAFRDAPLWNSVTNKKMWNYYLKGHKEKSLLDEDFSAFPPTYIEIAQYDCLRDEGKLLAERMTEQGVRVTLRQTNGTMHGYDAVMKSFISKESLRNRIEFLSGNPC